MMPPDSIDELLRQIQCPVCLDSLEEPRTLVCGHSFCKRCVAELWQATKDEELPKCPQCRGKFESFGKRNFALESIVSMLKKSEKAEEPKLEKRHSLGGCQTSGKSVFATTERHISHITIPRDISTKKKRGDQGATELPQQQFFHNRTLRNSYTFGLFQEYEKEAIRNSYTYGLAERLEKEEARKHDNQASKYEC